MKYLLSPTIIAFDIHYKLFLISYSINTGAIFSPPAVIINSFNLPVMYKFPFLSIYPISPLCKNPFLSIVFLVSSSLLWYPTNLFLPL